METKVTISTTNHTESYEKYRSIDNNVFFIIDNQKILAHSFILMTNSPVFHQMISGKMKEKDLLNVPLEEDKEIFELMIDFMYTKSITCEMNCLNRLYKMADFYQVEQLSHAIEERVDTYTVTIQQLLKLYKDAKDEGVGSLYYTAIAKFLVSSPDQAHNILVQLQMQEVIDIVHTMKTHQSDTLSIIELIVEYLSSLYKHDTYEKIGKCMTCILNKQEVTGEQLLLQNLLTIPKQYIKNVNIWVRYLQKDEKQEKLALVMLINSLNSH